MVIGPTGSDLSYLENTAVPVYLYILYGSVNVPSLCSPLFVRLEARRASLAE